MQSVRTVAAIAVSCVRRWAVRCVSAGRRITRTRTSTTRMTCSPTAASVWQTTSAATQTQTTLKAPGAIRWTRTPDGKSVTCRFAANTVSKLSCPDSFHSVRIAHTLDTNFRVIRTSKAIRRWWNSKLVKFRNIFSVYFIPEIQHPTS